MMDAKNYITMVLQKETKAGLTFGQILSLLTVIGGMMVAWISLNVRIAQAEVRIQNLEHGFEQTLKSVETIRLENRSDHFIMMEKLDEIMKIKADK
jgi:hypothetical protein